MLQNKQVNVNIEIDFNTLSTNNLAQILNKILQFLMHQRYQIPFNYLTFEHIVDSFANRAENELDKYTQLTKFDVNKQRKEAKQTKDAIQHMGMLFKEVLEQHVLRTVRFLFGASPFLPKEVYSVHLPFEFPDTKHKCAPLSTFILNDIMLKLVTNEHLCNVFAKTLNTTSLYVDMEVLQHLSSKSTSSLSSNMQNKTLVQLPQSCKKINLHLVHKPVIVIYEDPNPITDNVQNTAEENLSIVSENVAAEWWEALTIVRGFKQKSNHKISIW